jgi:hypothetical protein
MIVNLTPHVIRLNDGREFAPSGAVARVTANHSDDGWLSDGPDGPVTLDDEFLVDSIRLFRVSYGETEGLPAPRRSCNACEGATCPGMEPGNTCGEKVWYVVSGVVAQAAKGRDDILVPATGHPDAVRKDGQVFSVPGFVRG